MALTPKRLFLYLCISISLLRPYTLFSRSPLVNKTLTDEYRKTIEEMESDEEFWELEELKKELSKILEDCEGEKSDTMDSQQQQAGQTGNVTIGRQSPAAPASTSVPVGNTFIFQQQVMSARKGKVDRVRFLVLLQVIRKQLVDACARLYSRNSMRLQVNISQRLHISMKAISRLQPPSSRPFFTFFQLGTSDQDILLMETLPQVLCEASVHGQSKVVSMLLDLDTFSEFDLNIAASFAFLFGRKEVLQVLEMHNVDVNEDKLLDELIDDHGGGNYTQIVFSQLPLHCVLQVGSLWSCEQRSSSAQHHAGLRQEQVRNTGCTEWFQHSHLCLIDFSCKRSRWCFFCSAWAFLLWTSTTIYHGDSHSPGGIPPKPSRGFGHGRQAFGYGESALQYLYNRAPRRVECSIYHRVKNVHPIWHGCLVASLKNSCLGCGKSWLSSQSNPVSPYVSPSTYDWQPCNQGRCQPR